MPTTASLRDEARGGQVPNSGVGIVLGAFDGAAQSGVASGDDAAHQVGRGVEGRRALGGVEHAQAAAGPGPNIDKIAAMLDGGHDRSHGFFNPRDLVGDGGWNASVGGVHRGQDAAGRKRPDRMPFGQFMFR